MVRCLWGLGQARSKDLIFALVIIVHVKGPGCQRSRVSAKGRLDCRALSIGAGAALARINASGATLKQDP